MPAMEEGEDIHKLFDGICHVAEDGDGFCVALGDALGQEGDPLRLSSGGNLDQYTTDVVVHLVKCWDPTCAVREDPRETRAWSFAAVDRSGLLSLVQGALKWHLRQDGMGSPSPRRSVSVGFSPQTYDPETEEANVVQGVEGIKEMGGDSMGWLVRVTTDEAVRVMRADEKGSKDTSEDGGLSDEEDGKEFNWADFDKETCFKKKREDLERAADGDYPHPYGGYEYLHDVKAIIPNLHTDGECAEAFLERWLPAQWALRNGIGRVASERFFEAVLRFKREEGGASQTKLSVLERIMEEIYANRESYFLELDTVDVMGEEKDLRWYIFTSVILRHLSTLVEDEHSDSKEDWVTLAACPGLGRDSSFLRTVRTSVQKHGSGVEEQAFLDDLLETLHSAGSKIFADEDQEDLTQEAAGFIEQAPLQRAWNALQKEESVDPEGTELRVPRKGWILDEFSSVSEQKRRHRRLWWNAGDEEEKEKR